MENNQKLNLECGRRLKNALKKMDVLQKDFADMVHFTQQYISDICRGVKPMTYENAYNFGKILGVRQEYLLALDDYMTESEMKEKQVSSLYESIGTFFTSPDADRKISRLKRITELAEAFEQLKKCYGVPEGWNEKPIAEGMKFLLYLDEQIEHAFKTYFKYIDENAEDDDPVQSDALSGFQVLLEDTLNAIFNLYHAETSSEEFFELLKKPTEQQRVEKAITEAMTKRIKG